MNESGAASLSESRQIKGLKSAVKPLGLGLWAAGGGWGEINEAETLEVIDSALASGINFFDTADVYGNGLSETLLGKAMRGRRSRFVVATKIGWIKYDGTNNRSYFSTPEKVVEAAEDCLRRLDTDHIDLLQNHIFYREPHTDIMIEGFERLLESGKILAYGMSTGSMDFVRDFASSSQCSSLQIDYSILNRVPESEIFPFCLDRGIGAIIRGPLAMGILTGKLSADSNFTGANDHRRAWVTDPVARATYLDDLANVEQLRKLTSPSRSLSQLAIQFALRHPAVAAVIPGARTLSQLRENIGAINAPPLQEDELREINRIVTPGGGRLIWPA
jgi:aryl-alcohol dehydrogenase-like predicted oxidoreductase